jgi:dTMP kinase
MAEKKSLFIVIEGLDGSGKTSVSRQLANTLDYSNKGNVKLTFEPHDPSCGGLFIRQILMKKYRDFTPSLLPLAFAANRLDHCDREIRPWINNKDNHVLICDRYYLSSLVYQSSADFPFEKVMLYNEFVVKPDIIFFINVDNKVCYERMKVRNQPKELFEVNLSESRKKYFQAIDYLRTNHNENIIEIDGSGTISEVVEKLQEEIYKVAPHLIPPQPIIHDSLLNPHTFTLNGGINYTILDFLNSLESYVNYNDVKIYDNKAENNLIQSINSQLNRLDFDGLGSLFLDYIREIGYNVGTKSAWSHIDCYELEFQMPANITQRGIALLINETQRYDVIMQIMPELNEMSDFMLVFSPGPSEVVTTYYERSRIQYRNRKNDLAISISPSTQLITVADIAKKIIDIALKKPDIKPDNVKIEVIEN